MDPVANRDEQLYLAQSILVLCDDISQEADAKIAADATRLAELVLELDGWRSKGGFDPYNPPWHDGVPAKIQSDNTKENA